MGFIKRNLLKVIEWKDDSRNTLVLRYDVPDRFEIMKHSKLVVSESQAAIFVCEGQIADVFTAGTYDLDTNNLPVLTNILSWKYAFESPYKGDVYYVNLKQFTNIKWGTQNPIMMRDKDFGMIRLRGFGNFAFRVKYPKIFMRELFGTVKSFKTEDIEMYLKNIILTTLTDMIGTCNIPALDLASQYIELGDSTKDLAMSKFEELGLEITNVFVQNLSLPPEVEKAMDERTKLGVFGGKLNEYTQLQAANAIGDAARNQGGMAGTGASLGAGVAFGNIMAQTMNGAFANNSSEQSKNQSNSVCPNCGASVSEKAKFCPECGEKIVKKKIMLQCPKCGAKVGENAKFCPECGQPMSSTCSNCGATLKANAKFCPECGEKIK